MELSPADDAPCHAPNKIYLAGNRSLVDGVSSSVVNTHLQKDLMLKNVDANTLT